MMALTATDVDIHEIIQIVSEVGQLPELAPDADIYEAGFQSLNALRLLIELEDRWQVTIPDDEFIACRTAGALQAMLSRLVQEPNS